MDKPSKEPVWGIKPEHSGRDYGYRVARPLKIEGEGDSWEVAAHYCTKERAELFAAALNGWQPIETAPPAQNVYVFGKNALGKGRTFKAHFLPKFHAECDYLQYDPDAYDYHEENDCYYYKEGWYESIENWDEFTSIYVTDVDLSLWTPLPAPPMEGEAHD